MAKWKKITESDWRTIHLLKQRGLSEARIAELVDRSRSIVYYASKADSFEDFKKITYESRHTLGVEAVIPKSLPVRIPVHSEAEPEAFNKPAEPSDTDNVLRVLENLNQGLLSFAETLERMEGKLDDVLETKRPWLKNLRKP